MKKLGYVFIMFLLLICSFTLISNVKESYAIKPFEEKQKSMYLWSIDSIDYSSFDKVVDYLDIDTLYIGSYRDLNSYKNSLLFSFASQKELNSYMVYGEKLASLNEIKDLIDKVVTYNNNHVYQITGLAIDSEFHTTDEYRNADQEGKIEMFRTYVDLMKEAYAYAQANNLKFVACIPVNYDSISESILEELIRDGSDYIQIMNYNKNGKITKIKKEVELAQKYNKEIESIAELLPPGHHDVIDAITFWNEGLDACTNSFKEIDNYYKYDLMKFSYHYYNPVIELAKNVLDLTTDYDLELTLKDEENNTKEINNVYLTNDEEKIKGASIFNKDTNQYVLYFYGVSYDKEYEIVVENDSYIYEITDKVIKYDKNTDRLKNIEKTYIESERLEEIEPPLDEIEQPLDEIESPIDKEEETTSDNVENTVEKIEKIVQDTTIKEKPIINESHPEEIVSNNKPTTVNITYVDNSNKTEETIKEEKTKVVKKHNELKNNISKKEKNHNDSKKSLFIILGIFVFIVGCLIIKKFNIISLKSSR